MVEDAPKDAYTVQAAPAEAPGAPAIDMRTISEFAATDEAGAEFIANIIEVFLRDMGERLRMAVEQVGRGDNAGLAATAHALKGSCGHFGAVRLMKLCAAIEDQVKSKQTGGMRAAVDCMIAEADRVREALKAYRYNPPSPPSAA